MSSTSPNPAWVLQKKAVLVSSPDSHSSCFTRFRVFYDEAADTGSISVRITADLTNPNGRSQVLMLNLPPEIVEDCTLALQSNDDLCPPDLVSLLRTSVNHVSAVTTLSLTLNTTGAVVCPPDMELLTPANPGDLNFRAFAEICRSKLIRIHFAKRHVTRNDLDQLKKFSCALRKTQIRAESLDFTRHRVVLRDWRAFDLSLDPPSYYEEPVSEQVNPPQYYESVEQGAGKRQRDPWSISPDDERRKRLLLPSPQPPDSPTEVNTPSVLSPSPFSIRPTSFKRAFSPTRTELSTLARLERELHGVSDELICKTLIQTGRQHLLAAPEVTGSDQPHEVEKASSVNDDTIEQRLKRYVDEMIDIRLKSRIDEIVDNTTAECRDHIYDECKTNEAEFREHVEDGNLEVRNTTNECIKELDEIAQKYMGEIEGQAQQCMNDIDYHGVEVEKAAEEKVTKLNTWFNASTKTLLDSKSSYNYKLGTHAKRNSIWNHYY